MKIIQTHEELEQQPVMDYQDLTEIFLSLQEEHRNVFMIEIEGTVFFYRSLGRSEWKKLVQNEDISELEKQDIVCQVCTLWPQDFNFDDCSAGLPDILCKKILQNSFLDSVESRKNVLNYYRSEMFDLENQITCVINEAFPQFDIEEIERWDIEKTTKYLSRAEWKLHNLRGLQFVDQSDQMESFYERTEQYAPEPQPEPQTISSQPQQKQETTMRGGSKSNKLTPEKIEEMKRLQEKFPEINFFADTILTEGEAGMVDSIDTVAPALRPGF